MPTVHLRRNLERAIRRGHPWIYEDALAPSKSATGEVVTVRDRRDRFLARGIREAGPLGVRVWTLDGGETLDAALVEARLRESIARRARWEAAPDTDAYRLVNGEGDRLPGVVVDRYGRHAVARLEGAIAETGFALDALKSVLGGLHEGVLLRRGRKASLEVSLLCGERPPDAVTVSEHGMKLVANLWRGQKTGLFLDHRASRRRIRRLVEGLVAERGGGARVLNLYGYTGGFSIAAGLGGAAHVTTIDVAAPAIELADASWRANGLPADAHHGRAADVPTYLAEAPQPFDVIVADPPSFAPHRKAVDAALAAYRKLHAASLTRLRPGGFYLAASCSSHVDHAMFSATLTDGAADAGVVLQVLERWGGGDDHPRLAAFPEGDYLSVVLTRTIATAPARRG